MFELILLTANFLSIIIGIIILALDKGTLLTIGILVLNCTTILLLFITRGDKDVHQ